ncbi:MAG: 4Fe-4S dicluster domain-containing protein [Candidatus Fermentibacteria bacterium]|nr:4Fe-4S dicluster domain-containing protein [Candidatus Fermentibacteria bacterium]
MNTTENLRETIKTLISEKKVDLFLGWEKGSLPLSATPLFVTTGDEAERAVFDVTCGNNLSIYFTKDKKQYADKKVGIAVKGCDSRSVVLNILEKQIKREDVVIVGVPCDGVLDRKKVLAATEGREVLELIDSGDTVTVKGRGFDISMNRQDILSSSCLACIYPDAQEYDYFVGEPRGEVPNEERVKEIVDFQNLPDSERWEQTRSEYQKCIRCYACRNVCPSCYCNVCFVDQNDPKWIGSTCEYTDTVIFHVIRNLHVAGRCVECGACERACPMDINLLMLNRKVAMEVKDRFGDIAGLDINGKPAMSDFKEDEKQKFIMG